MMKQAGDRDSAKAGNGISQHQANADKADAEQRKGKRGALPAVRGEVEGDKGGDNAETDGAKGQPQAVRPDFSHHRVKGRSGAGVHLDVLAGTSEQQTDGRDQHYHRSKAADAKIVIEGNSQRRPDRHRHIGRHAVPGDNP